MPATVSAGMPGPLSVMMIVVVADLDADHRRGAGFLGSVEGVVGQFLENDERPLVGAVADLFDQLALGAEVEQAGKSGTSLAAGRGGRWRPSWHTAR